MLPDNSPGIQLFLDLESSYSYTLSPSGKGKFHLFIETVPALIQSVIKSKSTTNTADANVARKKKPGRYIRLANIAALALSLKLKSKNISTTIVSL